MDYLQNFSAEWYRSNPCNPKEFLSGVTDAKFKKLNVAKSRELLEAFLAHSNVRLPYTEVPKLKAEHVSLLAAVRDGCTTPAAVPAKKARACITSTAIDGDDAGAGLGKRKTTAGLEPRDLLCNKAARIAVSTSLKKDVDQLSELTGLVKELVERIEHLNKLVLEERKQVQVKEKTLQGKEQQLQTVMQQSAAQQQQIKQMDSRLAQLLKNAQTKTKKKDDKCKEEDESTTIARLTAALNERERVHTSNKEQYERLREEYERVALALKTARQLHNSHIEKHERLKDENENLRHKLGLAIKIACNVGGSQSGMGGGEDRSQAQAAAREHKLECSLEELFTGCTKKLKDANTNKRYDIDVKPGWKSGTKIKFDNPTITFIVNERKHPFFARDGDDLRWQCKLTRAQSIKGVQLTVPMLDGTQVKVSTKGERVYHGGVMVIVGPSLFIAGHGMPIKGGPARGNLVIEFSIID